MTNPNSRIEQPKITKGGAGTVYTCPCCGKILLITRAVIRGWGPLNQARTALKLHKQAVH